MKNLIIWGDQGTGKTVLTNWINMLRPMYIEEDCTKKFIQEDKPKQVTIYTCQEQITYEDVDRENYLIISLNRP